MEEHQANRDDHHHCHVDPVHVKYRTRWIISIILIPLCLFLARPLIARQILYRASSYQACRLYQESIRQYRKALFIHSANAEGWNDLAEVHKIIGEPDKAIEAYRRALESKPQNRKALYKLGMMMAISKEQPDEAMKLWSKAKEAGPESIGKRKNDPFDYHALSLRALATGYERSNHVDKAVNILEELVNRYPNDEPAKEKLKLLKELNEGQEHRPMYLSAPPL